MSRISIDSQLNEMKVLPISQKYSDGPRPSNTLSANQHKHVVNDNQKGNYKNGILVN